MTKPRVYHLEAYMKHIWYISSDTGHILNYSHHLSLHSHCGECWHDLRNSVLELSFKLKDWALFKELFLYSAVVAMVYTKRHLETWLAMLLQVNELVSWCFWRVLASLELLLCLERKPCSHLFCIFFHYLNFLEEQSGF